MGMEPIPPGMVHFSLSALKIESHSTARRPQWTTQSRSADVYLSQWWVFWPQPCLPWSWPHNRPFTLA